jgi:anaerobic magnesium-protoporphyrin IX monomethyl ester cyclase
MLLINPSVHAESQSSAITPFIYNTFPTGLGVIAGYLRKYDGIEPRIFDEQIRPFTDVSLKQAILEEKEPRIVGLSLLTINSARAYEVARRIKRIDPKVLVVVGGIHATVLPEECLSAEGVDVAIRREGEITLSELIRRVREGKGFEELEGISYRRNGNYVHNPDRPVIEDLNILPPFPYDLFEKNRESYRDFGTVITSRGCPYDCIFCSQRAITGRRYRYFSNERVLAEIELLIEKYGVDNIWFMDDNFVVNRKRALSLMDGIIQAGYQKKAGFVAEMRGESVTYELLNKMKEANFRIMSLGMETLVPRLLEVVEKGETVEENIRAVKMAHEVGISTSTTFIFGIPTETREERRLTARKARELPLDDARFNVAVPYPGTKLYEIAKREGRLQVKPGWSNFNVQSYMFMDDIPYAPRGTSREELIHDTYMANLRFNFRYKVIKSWLFSPISGGMVLTLPKRWYLSPREIGKLISLAFLFARRFFQVMMYALKKNR